ncbi:EamA family transporter [Ancrocorticia populi]|uniref:EamA family transporter n=1 Tax=Ancrocorticia populi TaxID=2175228 RepID=UPI001A9C2C44|nr:EamA family transporter [Ancrocorticia populi]MDN6486187.1 EamA family transporter [Ancrocorticia sp.]
MSDAVSPQSQSGRASIWAPMLMLGSGISQYVGASFAVGLFAVAPAISVGWGRIAAAAIIMLVWRRALPRRPDGSFDWHMLGRAALFGIVLGGMNLNFYMAIDRIPLGTAVSIEYIGPVLLAALTGRGWRVRTGITLAALGVFLISWAGVDMSDPSVAAGVGFVLLAGLFWALYIWIGRKVAIGGRGLDSLSWAMMVAGLVYIPLGAPGIGPIVSDWKLLLALFAVGTLSSALPYGIDQIVMRKIPAPTMALLTSLLPVTSLLVGLVMLQQIPNWAEVTGLILVSIAVALATSHTQEEAEA